jgi:hypothetical protein
MKTEHKTPRRDFLGKLAGTTLGLPVLLSTLESTAATPATAEAAHLANAEDWFKKIKGKHRIVYDAPEPHAGMPFIWTWVFYKTNNQTNSPDSDITAVVVLRHNGIPFAMEDRLWEKYKFGETFKVTDNTTGAPAKRNPFYTPKDGDFPLPGVDGIKTMQSRGAMFCVCDLALTVYSGMVAKGMNLNPEEVRKDWVSGLLPGIQPVPSGVWAIGRAQENGCGYCYTGG